MAVTVTYSQGAKGWTSFHSYEPQWLLGMNSSFYSFYQGKPWRHYQNPIRNSYYGSPSFPSLVEFILNEAPLETKMFKTLELEGTDAWSATLESDLHIGEISKDFFVQKEGVWFANVRRTDEQGNNYDFSQISAQGIGTYATFNTAGAQLTITFGVDINPIVCVGDIAYEKDSATTVSELGPITQIGTNSITIAPFVNTPDPNVPPTFILALKNSIAESYGLRGHYAKIQLQITTENEAELFAVSSSIFKSYP
tara:strand:+ start:218 stop:976 length:759 start_codon:yes stop_codon:yes gene_type:complete